MHVKHTHMSNPYPMHCFSVLVVQDEVKGSVHKWRASVPSQSWDGVPYIVFKPFFSATSSVIPWIFGCCLYFLHTLWQPDWSCSSSSLLFFTHSLLVSFKYVVVLFPKHIDNLFWLLCFASISSSLRIICILQRFCLNGAWKQHHRKKCFREDTSKKNYT